MREGIKVWIQNDLFTGGLKIAFASRYDGKTHMMNLYTGQTKEIGEDGVIPNDYILKVPLTMERELLQALAKALDEQGVKTENDHKIAGILEAQKAHLEDMRKLVFKVTP